MLLQFGRIPHRFIEGVPVVQDGDQYSTDLGKCMCALQEKEQSEGIGVSFCHTHAFEVRTGLSSSSRSQTPYDLVLLGGLSGRLDHTVHVLAFLHKLRQSGRRIFAVTDDNVGWVLDEAGLVFSS